MGRLNGPWKALVVVLWMSTAACSGDADEAALEARLPHVGAPLDTSVAHAAPRAADTAAAAPGSSDSAGIAWDAPPPRPSLPAVSQLTYARYRNEAYGYSIAYPDTLLKPGDAVGEHRGRAFASPDGQVRMVLYAAEDATSQVLADQYQGTVEDAELRVTYHVLEPDWYVVSGYRGDHKVYEKGVLGATLLTTFRLQYPRVHEDYYDAVAATMASSFER